MTTELSERPFLSYLSQLSAEITERLYKSPPCCLAIFRMLPAVAQQCVAIMVFNREFDVKEQCNPELQRAIDENILLLRTMRLLVKDPSSSGDIQLNTHFRRNYLLTMRAGPLEASSIAIKELDAKSRKSADRDLYKKAVERWECILSYLALPSETAEKNVSVLTRDLFQYVDFTKQSGNDFEITSLGFQFLLLGRNEQIWTYLTHYLKYLEATTPDDVFSLLEFFLRLCLCVTASDAIERGSGDDSQAATAAANRHISTPLIMSDEWSESVKNFHIHLRELGLVFIRKRKDGYFFVTPLLATLISTDSLRDAAAASAREKGFLLTETNYRIYAYTSSALHLSILSTFTELDSRFSNFVVAHMSRESVRRALQAGITARQITQYLRANAHRKTFETHGAKHCVPPTVVDQIHLWEEERERILCQDCVVYSQFDSDEEYARIREFAASKQFLLYDSPQQRLLVVNDEAHELVVKERQRVARLNGTTQH